MWQEPWAWIAAGVVLAILEVLVSGYVLLGFAIGALLVGALLWLGLLGANLAILLLVFAIASLLAWLALRLVFHLPAGQVKVIHRDINED